MLRLVAGAARRMHPPSAQDLSNKRSRFSTTRAGIRSLKRTNDVHDTDYIADQRPTRPAAGPLSHRAERRLARAAAMSRCRGHGRARSIAYLLGARQPTLASRSTRAAAAGAAGLRGLNDGLVPAARSRQADAAPDRAAARRRSTCRCSPGPARVVQRSGCSTRFPIDQELSQRGSVLGAAADSRGGSSTRTASGRRSRRAARTALAAGAFTRSSSSR